MQRQRQRPSQCRRRSVARLPRLFRCLRAQTIAIDRRGDTTRHLHVSRRTPHAVAARTQTECRCQQPLQVQR